MKTIESPRTLAQRIVSTVIDDLYDRRGFTAWWDGIADDILQEEILPALVAIVEAELAKEPR